MVVFQSSVSDSDIGYLFRIGKNNWTDRRAVEVLKLIFKEKERSY
ncbi:hypothetical protein [Oceanobacillus neutriphilus]|uniref:Uncharacterized protein n=1 Tax=Oceanobacillus neutriphilus TaxID=531815 RepID=A0ABQ2NUQ8_9BACI|nr:hypothetical protein [Oceanobacillus neutriphilus]GGP10998.1 hypothetical protein GCM10011346_21350 [Oceanobacillus neutriphilus]